jgi:hypothetical protein
MTRPSDSHAVDAAATLGDLVRAYDDCWSRLDFVALADLWERTDPPPIYVGDEYAEPLIGAGELDRHWARIAGRIKSASVTSTLHEYDAVGETVLRAVVLSRWRLTSTESDVQRSGASWITWLLVRRGRTYRIFHQMESQVYLSGDASDQHRGARPPGAPPVGGPTARG